MCCSKHPRISTKNSITKTDQKSTTVESRTKWLLESALQNKGDVFKTAFRRIPPTTGQSRKCSALALCVHQFERYNEKSTQNFPHFQRLHLTPIRTTFEDKQGKFRQKVPYYHLGHFWSTLKNTDIHTRHRLINFLKQAWFASKEYQLTDPDNKWGKITRLREILKLGFPMPAYLASLLMTYGKA